MTGNNDSDRFKAAGDVWGSDAKEHGLTDSWEAENFMDEHGAEEKGSVVIALMAIAGELRLLREQLWYYDHGRGPRPPDWED